MKFSKDTLKVGDKVLLKNRRGQYWNKDGKMDHYMGKIITIKQLRDGCFTIEEDDAKNVLFNWVFAYDDIEQLASVIKLQDLKFADVLTLRNGERYVVSYDFMHAENTVYRMHNAPLDSWYNDDLTQNEDEKEYDIVKVERDGQAIYERNEEVREMKMEEVNKALGFKVRIVE